MHKNIKKKLISLIGSILILVIFYILNPEAREFKSFAENYKRSILIENCQANIASTSKVLRIHDGDTIEVLTPECGVRTVRLIGVDTPETVDPRRPVQCFGKEASDFAKANLINQEVILETDPSGDEIDKYGRLLAFVFLQNGTNFNQLIIEKGYAYEYTYKNSYKYQKGFKKAEADAKLNQRGLWSSDTCSGKK
jgi:micrococcal nuclease